MSVDEIIDKFKNKKYYGEHAECLSKHLSNYFQEDEITVFHEMMSLDFHLDVYFIQPKNRDYNILLTSGMSSYEMTVDNEIENIKDYQFLELMILLPKDMKFGEVHTGKEKNGWIISMLKQTARFPHHYYTYLSIGHTIQATEDLEPYSKDTEFIGCLILPSLAFEKYFTEIICGDNKIIKIGH